MASVSPTVTILAGPNGAGKSTASRTLLAERLKLATFVNADVIAQGLAAFAPESVAVEAGRIMLDHLHFLAEQRADFAFETTLAGRGMLVGCVNCTKKVIGSSWRTSGSPVLT